MAEDLQFGDRPSASTRGSAVARSRHPGKVRIEALVILGVVVVVVAAAARFSLNSRDKARRAVCLENLSRIGQAMAQYVEESGRCWPSVAKLPSMEYHQPPWPSLPTLLLPRLGGQREVFRCPADARTLEEGHPLRARFPAATTYFQTEGTSYEWVLQEIYSGQPVGRDPFTRAEGLGMGAADQPIIWEYRPFHGKPQEAGSFNILYADFQVRPVRGSASAGG